MKRIVLYYHVMKVELGYAFLELCGHAHGGGDSTFGWFHFKIARKIGGACCVCILDVIFLRSTSNEHGSFAFEAICLKVLSSRVKKLLDCVCKISLLLLCLSRVVCQGLFRCWLLCGILPILLITSLCV
ncbi:hypothetical protein VPH35_097034 [Triticum aestivum]